MRDEKKDAELTKEQLDEAAGGGGGKGGAQKGAGDLDHVRCPSCGAKNEIPTTCTIVCCKCGAEFEP